MRKISVLLAAALAAAMLFAGCSQASSNSAAAGGDLLKVGVRKNLSNFSVYNEDADTCYGFEADLALELSTVLGYGGVQYVSLDPEEREDAVSGGEVDCLIAAFSYTADRAEKFDLSQPYYYDSGRVMIEKSTLFSDYADLAGSKVAVRSGTDAAENITAKLIEEGLIASADEVSSFLEIVEYDSYEAMNTALEYGDVDALCADGCITLPWMNSERAYFASPYSEEEYVIATIKGSPLTDKIASALSELSDNGTIADLEVKWGINNEEE